MSLEQKEQAIRRALAQAGVQEAAQIVKLIKCDDMAEVYINGQYFDTFDFNGEKFLNHNENEDAIQAPVQEKPGAIMFAAICSEKYLNNKYYISAQLGFPASAADIETAFEQAGIGNTEGYQIEFLRWKDYIFDSDEIIKASVEELNFFSRRVSKMDEETRLAFEGSLIINQKYQSIKDLINLTYSLENCRVLHNISNDAELGSYYANNGLVEELQDIPETMLAFIDFEKIGKAMRESENGVFLNGYYITNESGRLAQAYDGETLPKDYDFDNTFTVYISFDNNMEEKSLSLPADEGQISAFLKDFENNILSCNSKVMTAKPNLEVRGE